MTTCDEILTPGRPRLSRKLRILLFFLVETVVAPLIGFAVLFVSFEPGWSSESQQAALIKPSDARGGALMLKTEDGYADAPRARH
jgi:Ca-activated chloride channel family protein